MRITIEREGRESTTIWADRRGVTVAGRRRRWSWIRRGQWRPLSIRDRRAEGRLGTFDVVRAERSTFDGFFERMHALGLDDEALTYALDRIAVGTRLRSDDPDVREALVVLVTVGFSLQEATSTVIQLAGLPGWPATLTAVARMAQLGDQMGPVDLETRST